MTSETSHRDRPQTTRAEAVRALLVALAKHGLTTVTTNESRTFVTLDRTATIARLADILEDSLHDQT